MGSTTGLFAGFRITSSGGIWDSSWYNLKKENANRRNYRTTSGGNDDRDHGMPMVYASTVPDTGGYGTLLKQFKLFFGAQCWQKKDRKPDVFRAGFKKKKPRLLSAARTEEGFPRCTGERLGLKACKCKMEFQHVPWAGDELWKTGKQINPSCFLMARQNTDTFTR